MQQLIQKIFRPGFVWLAEKITSAPDKYAVNKSLTALYKIILTKKSHRGVVIEMDAATERFIIFSDQHKGDKSDGDDFKNNEENYITALKHYLEEDYCMINLGDAEELWKYKPDEVIPNCSDALQAEAAFQQKGKYFRTFGNHDLLWKNKKDVNTFLKTNFEMPLRIYEGIVLRTKTGRKTLHIFLTHGHQGDQMSDNNALSTWLVAHIWSPIQRYLQININTPAKDFQLRDKHNQMMYEWSIENKNLLLITGHTHKPVFASGKYTRLPEHKIDIAAGMAEVKPSYFNSGCCCYNDGDITGIEIGNGGIRLIKWHNENGVSSKMILEEKSLQEICSELHQD